MVVPVYVVVVHQSKVAIQFLLVLASIHTEWTLDNLDFLVVDIIQVSQMDSGINGRMRAYVALVLSFDFSRWQMIILHLSSL